MKKPKHTTRLYSNENFPLPAVEELRKLGYDVLTIQETGKAGEALSDESVLAFSIKKKRAILTINRKHFIQLHNANPYHFGIIVCTFDPDFIRQAHRIDAAIKHNKNISEQLIRINRPV